MTDVYGVFWTDSECGCSNLTAIFRSEELARAHALELGLGNEVYRLDLLSARPERIVVFNATYYSTGRAPIGASDTHWSYQDGFEQKRQSAPPLKYWTNGMGFWCLTAFGKTKEETESALDRAVSARLNEIWSFVGAGGTWY